MAKKGFTERGDMKTKNVRVYEKTINDVYAAAQEVARASKEGALKGLPVGLMRNIMVLASQAIRMKKENEDH